MRRDTVLVFLSCWGRTIQADGPTQTVFQRYRVRFARCFRLRNETPVQKRSNLAPQNKFKPIVCTRVLGAGGNNPTLSEQEVGSYGKGRPGRETATVTLHDRVGGPAWFQAALLWCLIQLPTVSLADGRRTGPGGTPTGVDGRALSCLLYTSPSPRDRQKSRMPSSA